MINKVEICGVNTSKLPVLKNDEMRTLFKAMQAGDNSAREQLIQGNLRLVLSVIQRFSNRGEYVDDLFQVGCIGPVSYTHLISLYLKLMKRPKLFIKLPMLKPI